MPEPDKDLPAFLAACERFVAKHGNQCRINVSIECILAVLAQLQLAARHPYNKPLSMKLAREFIQIVYCEIDDPELLCYLRRGDDPRWDVVQEAPTDGQVH